MPSHARTRFVAPRLAAPVLLGAAALFALPPAPAEAGPEEERNANIAFATRLGDAFASVAERASASVVSIRVEARRVGQATPFGRIPGGVQRGGGSGVIVRADGYVLTNNHVVNGASRIVVSLRDGREFPAEVVGVDPATDLAVVRIQATGLRAATFAERSGIRVGEWAVAIGSPFGLDYSVTAGIVSAVGRGVGMNEIEDYVQTDASINPGNSGGALVNLRGEVIGINTMIVGRGSGIGFAVVSDLAERVAEQLIAGGRVRRAYLGVSYQPLTPALNQRLGLPESTRGARIGRVEDGGPAARAGLRPDDVIVAIDGAALEDGNALVQRIVRTRIGDRLRLTILRQGQPRQVEVTTAERPVRQRRPRR